jgi:hypothetical protein
MKRLSILAVALLAGIPATARADILWDLVHDAGSGGDYGTTKTASNAGFGSITASSQTTVHVFGNFYDAGGDNGGNGPLGAYNMASATPNIQEKGFGMCVPGTNCTAPPANEIGLSPNTGSLYLDLTGVTNSGPLNHIWLASVQPNENYAIYGSLTGTAPLTGTSYVLICSGNQPTISGAIADCAVGANYKFLRFDPGAAGDFSVQALRFSSTVPEPGTMGLLATGLVALTGAGFIRRRKKN